MRVPSPALRADGSRAQVRLLLVAPHPQVADSPIRRVSGSWAPVWCVGMAHLPVFGPSGPSRRSTSSRWTACSDWWSKRPPGRAASTTPEEAVAPSSARPQAVAQKAVVGPVGPHAGG